MVTSTAASLSRMHTLAWGSPKPVRKRRKPAAKARPGPLAVPKDRHPAVARAAARTVAARHLDRSHSCPAGARDFKLFLPARQPTGPRGLIVMLHGCSQDPDDFATGTDMNAAAQRHGLAVAWPAQTRTHNAASCWNWFSPANQKRGTGEPAVLAGLARELMREFGLAPGQVFVAGLSAGGAMAVILAETYPDVFAAAGVHSGLARGAASGVVSALSAMRGGAAPSRRRRPPAATARTARRIVFHGDADTDVHPSNAAQIVQAAVGTRTPARATPAAAAGRDYLRTEYALPDGTVDVELWQVKGAGHAWSGGKAAGSFADPRGPDASAEMVRFFLAPPGG